jgi:hypothetical protein
MMTAKPMLAILTLAVAAAPAMADPKIIAENWAPCANAANGVVYERTTNFRGEPIIITRLQPPAWTRTRSLRPYYLDNPLLLATHGLCNAKFHRLVICLPGWQENHEDTPTRRVCAAYAIAHGFPAE